MNHHNPRRLPTAGRRLTAALMATTFAVSLFSAQGLATPQPASAQTCLDCHEDEYLPHIRERRNPAAP